MCSGRVDLAFVLRAFSIGMDGVIIVGCRLNECNYATHGNYDALGMVFLCKKIMEHLGLNPERLRIEFMSSGEGILFAQTMNGFCNQVRGMGPLGRSESINGEQLKQRLKEVVKLVPYIKMEKREKLASHFQSMEQYKDLFSAEEIEALLRDAPSYYIDPVKCKACMICHRRCPVEAISGGKSLIHVIDQGRCIKCGTCLEACPPRFSAVRKFVGEPVPPPVPDDQRVVIRKGKESAVRSSA